MSQLTADTKIELVGDSTNRLSDRLAYDEKRFKALRAKLLDAVRVFTAYQDILTRYKR